MFNRPKQPLIVVLQSRLLAHIMQPKPAETPAPTSAETREKEHYSQRLSGALSSSIFSIGDLFRDGQKSVKFPEKLLKVLEQKLQNIAMGKDPACADFSAFFVDRYSRLLLYIDIRAK